MLYCNYNSIALVTTLTPTSQHNAASSLNSLFTASAAVRCAGAVVLLALLWLGIFWAVSLP
ncbi:hypothetical protein EGY12_12230 [Serratia sp. FDAARGOS_506]|nr:hypothetical protein EGY12_12230 [Serratia sp. FDAARGOS_506]